MSPVGLLAALAAAAATAAALPPRPPPVRPPAAATRAPVAASGTAAGRPGSTAPPPRHRLLLAAAVGVGLAALAGHLVGLGLGAVGAVVTWRVSGRMESPESRRRRERLAAALPLVVDLMAATLAAGLSPAAALARVSAAIDGPVAEELGTLAARLDLGVHPSAAWAELGRHPQLGPLGRCVARTVDSGASVAEAMTRLAEDLRGDLRAQVEARARSVGVKAAVPLGVCMLPAFLLVGVVPLVVGAVPVVLGR